MPPLRKFGLLTLATMIVSFLRAMVFLSVLILIKGEITSFFGNEELPLND